MPIGFVVSRRMSWSPPASHVRARTPSTGVGQIPIRPLGYGGDELRFEHGNMAASDERHHAIPASLVSAVSRPVTARGAGPMRQTDRRPGHHFTRGIRDHGLEVVLRLATANRGISQRASAVSAPGLFQVGNGEHGGMPAPLAGNPVVTAKPLVTSARLASATAWTELR